MNGVGNDTQGIVVLDATNTPWQLNSAIRRRFEKRIYKLTPRFCSRLRDLFELDIGDTPCTLTTKDYRLLS